MQQVFIQDLGKITYRKAWDYQQKLVDNAVAKKLLNRKLPTAQKHPPTHHFLYCEHPHVYTLGRNGSAANLLLNEEGLKERGIEFFNINRGGDITYHGPGQIVGYPIFDMDYFFRDVHQLVRFMEEAVIRTLASYGIEAGRIKGFSGVWLSTEEPAKARKICAIGIHLSRWVTMHGFAFNVNTDLQFFDYIIPCGIKDKAVTSMTKELGRPIDVQEVKDRLLLQFADLFAFEPLYAEQRK